MPRILGPDQPRAPRPRRAAPVLREGHRRPANELVRWYRTGEFIFNGRTLIWAYPREAPEWEQVDLVEVMDLPARASLNTASTGAW